MKIHKLYITFGLMIALVLFFELAAHADEASESTEITFSAPIQIPGRVLPAGTYTLRRADPSASESLVEIFNADRSVYAVLQTVATERMEPGDTAITVAEPESGNPVFVKWFYPGRTTGHEFVYSKQQEKEIAQDKQETFGGREPIPSTEVGAE
jgi:Protein of unknown function (DUF2911)